MEQTIEVTVNPNATVSANFSFEGITAFNVRHSLEMKPAIELSMLGSH